ncbi:CDP-diacylglycerol--serine O-phosphatidyltransferase [Basidiobolus meristosporus CBS 931.73]|uniref:CDP-diacylglycerol--serine O-phosphatidyltransferase n=1 Tax=Basidiobolus meristosporus CBS 931.73 TaxID=1314790 RepID=A0A1Y1Y6B5_9FUNG|nr:CDP-diacylglycerol--serine O-phosphatidyltransferase [Basidiobolus meristosporus CBS 931.73]|eukprot:ORX93528.1 CDP-diacylglycerol--serine O-phosphatidyltransferase [Basidiobolus meristosporus CBS 931.73]
MLRSTHTTPAKDQPDREVKEVKNGYFDNHFAMMREFHLADFLTLANGMCGSSSIFSTMYYLMTRDISYIWLAMYLVPIGTFFDFMDGRVARWRKRTSLLGQELDSLADLISFGVAPAVLGFALGLNSFLDLPVLVYFISCGLARLARYNATVASLPKDSAGKVTYFEGTPIPTTLLIVAYFSYLVSQGAIESRLPYGVCQFGERDAFHPLVLIYAISGSLMISKSLKIPKP